MCHNQSHDKVFEREWRLLLVEHLKPALASLKRASAAERKKAKEAAVIASGYDSVDEAHNAFGYAEISEEQYRKVVEILECGTDGYKCRAGAAVERLTLTIGSIKGEAESNPDAEYEDLFNRRMIKVEESRNREEADREMKEDKIGGIPC